MITDEDIRLRRRSETKRKYGINYQNYIMIEEKPMELALATDDPYEVLEQSKEMNDIGCYF